MDGVIGQVSTSVHRDALPKELPAEGGPSESQVKIPKEKAIWMLVIHSDSTFECYLISHSEIFT